MRLYAHILLDHVLNKSRFVSSQKARFQFIQSPLVPDESWSRIAHPIFAFTFHDHFFDVPWIDHLILWTSGHAHPSRWKTKNCNAKQYDKTPNFLVHAILPSFLLFFEKAVDVFRPLPMVPSFSPWRNPHFRDFYHLASYQKVTEAIGGREESEKGEFL